MREKRRDFVFQGECAILQIGTFDDISVPGIDHDGCTFIFIKASQNKGSCTSHFLVAHLDHFNLIAGQMSQATAKVKDTSLSVKINIRKMFLELYNLGLRNFEVTIYDGSTETNSKDVLRVSEFIGSAGFLKLLKEKGKEITITVTNIPYERREHTLDFSIDSNGKLKIISRPTNEVGYLESPEYKCRIIGGIMQECKKCGGNSEQRYLEACQRNIPIDDFETNLNRLGEYREPKKVKIGEEKGQQEKPQKKEIDEEIKIADKGTPKKHGTHKKKKKAEEQKNGDQSSKAPVPGEKNALPSPLSKDKYIGKS